MIIEIIVAFKNHDNYENVYQNNGITISKEVFFNIQDMEINKYRITLKYEETRVGYGDDYEFSKQPTIIHMSCGTGQLPKYHDVNCKKCHYNYALKQTHINLTCFKNLFSNILESDFNLDTILVPSNGPMYINSLPNTFLFIDFYDFIVPEIIVKRFGELIPEFINFKNPTKALKLFEQYGCSKTNFIEYFEIVSDKNYCDKISFLDIKNFILKKFDVKTLGKFFRANLYPIENPEYAFEMASYVLSNGPDENTKLGLCKILIETKNKDNYIFAGKIMGEIIQKNENNFESVWMKLANLD